MKNDGGWKDNLSRIADAHPNSPLAQQHKKRSIKEVKTQQVVEKHRRRQRGKKVMAKDIPDYLREYDLDQDWGFTPVSKAPESTPAVDTSVIETNNVELAKVNRM